MICSFPSKSLQQLWLDQARTRKWKLQPGLPQGWQGSSSGMPPDMWESHAACTHRTRCHSMWHFRRWA